MQQRLFVYGTLAPGQPNAHELSGIDGTWEPATLRGRLFAAGWGAASGYPGVVVDPAATAIAGHVLTSTDLHQHWRRLDAFEGDGYQRMLAPVQLASGAIVDAYVYALSAPQAGGGEQ
ncbi:MAG: gamma-glutamylcyclotransferase family protein [Pseudomonadota bacterium]